MKVLDQAERIYQGGTGRAYNEAVGVQEPEGRKKAFRAKGTA